MSSPGQKRGSCGHAMANFDGHAFCARCRDKKKGTDTCVESPTKDSKFCLLLTPEQKLQLATPSYKLKKEKRDAKKAELSSPSKDATLVDPSTVSVIGAVSDKVSVSSPWNLCPKRRLRRTNHQLPSPKKLLNDLLIRKWRSWIRNGRTDLIDWKHFSCLSPSYRPSHQLSKLRLPILLPLVKILNPFFNRPQQSALARTPLLCIILPASSVQSLQLHLPSALDWAPLLYCISLPASSDLTDHCKNLHLSALCPTSLLPSINRPASLLLTDPDRIHHRSALVVTPLLSSISRPASFHLTSTDLKPQSALVPTPLPPGISLPASLYLTDLILTDPSLQCLPTPALLICTD